MIISQVMAVIHLLCEHVGLEALIKQNSKGSNFIGEVIL